MTLYERMKAACEERDTTITAVLTGIGRPTSNTGAWKKGVSPSIDIIVEIADYLHMPIDELVRGKAAGSDRSGLSDSDREWLEIIDLIPADRQELCKGFLRTHIVEPEKYQDKKHA
ncbi:MAG: helix-turn-helix domain-containing protein [Oscillospiraceae bacterium]|nr:helix-turn-helix domain-containing protein [Oscillospiraceae bacterium]